MKIIARKPCDDISEYIVVERDNTHLHPYVSATANELSIKRGEWFCGYYFETKEQALNHFDSRPRMFRLNQDGEQIPTGRRM